MSDSRALLILIAPQAAVISQEIFAKHEVVVFPWDTHAHLTPTVFQANAIQAEICVKGEAVDFLWGGTVLTTRIANRENVIAPEISAKVTEDFPLAGLVPITPTANLDTVTLIINVDKWQ